MPYEDEHVRMERNVWVCVWLGGRASENPEEVSTFLGDLKVVMHGGSSCQGRWVGDEVAKHVVATL